MEQRWIEVTTDTQVDALLDAVRYCYSRDDSTRTMVFTNTVESANSVADILERVGVRCMLYHSDSSMEERAANLCVFREDGGVLVCTDAAARGLDIPNVSHVIQAFKFFPFPLLFDYFVFVWPSIIFYLFYLREYFPFSTGRVRYICS